MTTVREIEEWFDYGVENGYTHMLVMVDTYDNDDYPVYFKSKEEAYQRSLDDSKYVMEAYVLDPSRKKEQLSPWRNFQF